MKIDQRILRFLFTESTTNNMRNRIYFIMILNGRTNPDRSRTFSCGTLLQQTTFLFTINIFLAMIRNVNEGWLEFHQRVNIIEQILNVLTFQRRKNFQREQRFSFGVI